MKNNFLFISILTCALFPLIAQSSDLNERLRQAAHENNKDKWGNTALMLASREGREEVVNALLADGADPDDVKYGHGATALIIASAYGHLGVVNLLLDAGANKEAKDKWGNTALMLASYAGYIGVVNTLLAAQADKDAKSNSGITALLCASHKGHVEVVNVLLADGADPDIAYPVPVIANPDIADPNFAPPRPRLPGIQKALTLYRVFKHDNTLKNQLRKEAYQQYHKNKPMLLHLILGLDPRAIEVMKNNDHLRKKTMQNRFFFSDILGDDALGSLFSEVMKNTKKNDSDSADVIYGKRAAAMEQKALIDTLKAIKR